MACEADIRYFRAEANEVARLDHPNIVPVYEVGEWQGHHLFSMKLVEGGSLDRQLERDRGPLVDAGAFGFELSAVVLQVGVVEVGDKFATHLPERDPTVAVQQVRLVVVDHVADSLEPFLVPLRVLAVPPLVVRGGLGVIQVLPPRVGPIVRDTGQRAGLVGAVAVLEPGVTRAKMLGHAKAQALPKRRLAPEAHHIFLRPHLHGIPLMIF